MRQVRRFWFLAVGFCTAIVAYLLTPGQWLNRLLAVALCTVLTTDQVCLPHGMTGRAVAAMPQVAQAESGLVAQRSSEFDDVPMTPAPSNTVTPPPYPVNPGPNFPVRRPDFDESTSSLVGRWLYNIYISPSQISPTYSTLIEIEQDNDEYVIQLCESNCQIASLQNKDTIQQLQSNTNIGASVTEVHGSIRIVYFMSLDNSLVFGEVQEQGSGEKLFFKMERQNLVSSSGGSSFFDKELRKIEIDRKSSSIVGFKSTSLLSDVTRIDSIIADGVRPVRPVTPPTPPRQTGQQPGGGSGNPHPGKGDQGKKMVRVALDLAILGVILGILFLTIPNLPIIIPAIRIGALATRIGALATRLFAVVAAQPSLAQSQGNGSGQCGEEQVSGGQAGDRRRIQFNSNRGTISISYEHYDVPDRLQVIYEGKTVIDTGFVSGTGNPSFDLQGQANFAEVIVTGNPQQSTKWDYTLSCPQQAQRPEQPEPEQDKFFDATLSKSEIPLRDSAILTVRYVNPDNNSAQLVISGHASIGRVVVNIPPAQSRSGEFRFIVTNRGSRGPDCASSRDNLIEVTLYGQGGSLLSNFFSKELKVSYTGGSSSPAFLCEGRVVPQS